MNNNYLNWNSSSICDLKLLLSLISLLISIPVAPSIAQEVDETQEHKTLTFLEFSDNYQEQKLPINETNNDFELAASSFNTYLSIKELQESKNNLPLETDLNLASEIELKDENFTATENEIKPPEYMEPGNEIKPPEYMEPGNELTEPESDPDENRRSGWGVIARVSTVGIGADVVKSLTKNLNLRGGFSVFEIQLSEALETEIKYDQDLRVSLGVPLSLDWYPFNDWFFFNGGLSFNLNRVRFRSRTDSAEGTINIGDKEFDVALAGQIEAKVTYPLVSPFLGFGFGNAVKRNRGFGFFMNAGVLFQGKGSLDVKVTGSALVNDPEFNEAIIDETAELREQITVDTLTAFPILVLGVSYQF